MCVCEGLGAAWHCQHVEVEDVNARQRYMFPCNRWLSKSDDDKQICRELSCANLPSPSAKDKICEWFAANAGTCCSSVVNRVGPS